MIDIEEFCNTHGWTVTMLSYKAAINYRTAYRAYNGEPIAERSRIEIAEAISKQLGRKVYPSELKVTIRYRGKSKPKAMQPVA